MKKTKQKKKPVNICGNYLSEKMITELVKLAKA